MTANSTARRRLAAMGLDWPPKPPTHQYLPAVRFGPLVYVSGHSPYADGAHQYHGRVGETLDLDQARAAARLAVLGCLVSLEHALGSLDNLERILKINGYVHCVPGYEPLPKVTDAASELLIDLFDAAGRHARTTVGVASLPGGVAVELELTAAARE
ncbi:RidA family protein [Kribbella sp. NPDC055071]